MESITLPRIFFQNKNLAKEFNQKRYLNTVGKWVKYLPDDPRISIEVLADASYSSWSSAIKTNDNIFEPSLYLSPRDRQAISEDLEKEPTHEIPRGIVSANNGSLNNYYHWSIQTIPSIALTKKYLKEGFKLILRNGLNRYQKEWLSLLNIDISSDKIFRIKRREIVHAKELIVPLTLYKPYDYQPSKKALTQLREQILKSTNTSQRPKENPKKIYISRLDSKKARGLQNEKHLESQLKELGFLIVRSTEWSVSDQIHFFQNAELIVAPHGAGLSNIVFANPECRIIEINQSNYFNPCFSALHSCMEFRGIYDHYIAPPKTNNKKDTNSKHNQKTRVNNAKLIDLIMT